MQEFPGLPAVEPEEVGFATDAHQPDDGRRGGGTRGAGHGDRRPATGTAGVQAHAVGTPDMDRETELGMDSLFRTYSQTKPVSAVVLMSLFEEGAFLLNDPIANWLPEFAHPEVMARGAQGGIAKLRRELGLGASSSSGEPAATYDYRASAVHQVE